MAGRRGFRRLTAVCAALSVITAGSAALLWFVLVDGALMTGIVAILLGLAAWVSHGFALPDE